MTTDEYGQVLWSENDVVDYKRLEKMSVNDEVIFNKTLSAPAGVGAYATLTSNTDVTSSASYTQLFAIGNFYVGIERIILLSLHVGNVEKLTGKPEPIFRFQINGTTIVGRTWISSLINTDAQSIDTASVAFQHPIVGLQSGIYSFQVVTKDNLNGTPGGGGNYRVKADSTRPAIFFVRDMGARTQYV